MIVDHISNWQRYGFGPAWEEVMHWLENTISGKSLAGLEDGVHPVAGAFINVATMTSRVRSECRYEYHRRFCDVQFVLEGQEWLFSAPTAGLTPDQAFDTQSDIGFFNETPAEITRVTLRPGTFVLLFPWDAHLPAIAVDGVQAPLRKCIGKIPLEALHLA